MSFIPALVASINGRLDELAGEIKALQDARAALRTQTLAPTVAGENGRTTKQSRRSTSQRTPPAQAPQRVEIAQPGPTRGRTAPSNPATSRRRESARPGSKKRSVSRISPDQLHHLLSSARSGLSASAIAAQTGVGHGGVLAQLRGLEASGQVRRIGTRRSTMWLAITDEDRIATRAAELERQLGARRHDRTQRRGRARAS